MYGAEIWYPGLNQQLKKTVESFYVNNLRRILRVGSQTAIPAILLELGVFPVETQVKISLVKFAEKMQNNPTDKYSSMSFEQQKIINGLSFGMS